MRQHCLPSVFMGRGLLPDLVGRWRISRRIIGENARFKGEAVIAPHNGVLRYAENGILKQADTTNEAYRNYIYDVDGDTLRISHPDGAQFIVLSFENGQARASHQCGQDRYDAFFRFESDGRLTMVYDVRGPRKAFRVVSVFKRQFA